MPFPDVAEPVLGLAEGKTRGLIRATRHIPTTSMYSENIVMEIFAAGSRASRRMGADCCPGTVWQDPIIETPAPAILRSARVSFEPGARTAWHTHPLGQTLHVVS